MNALCTPPATQSAMNKRRSSRKAMETKQELTTKKYAALYAWVCLQKLGFQNANSFIDEHCDLGVN